MRSVVITGASTGIGRATALRLDRRGWRVFAGVRKEADGEALRGEASERLVPLTLDVTDPAQIAAATERVTAEVGEVGLDGLVNTAGIVVPGPLEAIAIDDFRRQLEVNLTGQLAVTQAMLPSLRRARGRIVLVSSIGGRFALPMSGAYHASKFGLEAVGDVLRMELSPWGIHVSLIEPGSIATPLWDRGQREADDFLAAADEQHKTLYGKAIATGREVARKTAARGIPPQKVAEAIEAALTARHPRPRYLVGVDARAQAGLKALVPTRVLDRLVTRLAGLRAAP
jgi:NAD(P)-dependent dehydrogenase (short-subunit alcohol dehydrogenase family)